MCFRYEKISGPKVIKGFVLAPDIKVSDPKMAKIDVVFFFGLYTDDQLSGRI